GREASPYRRATAAGAGESGDGMEGEGYREEDETLLLGLPLMLRKGGWLRRVAPVLLVVLTAAAVTFTIYEATRHDEPRERPAGEPVAQNDQGTGKGKVPVAPVVPEKTQPEPGADVKP